MTTLMAITLAWGLSLSVLGAGQVQGAEKCLEKLAKKVKPKQQVTIVRAEGDTTSGKFVSVDLSQSLLTILRTDQLGQVAEKTFTGSEIQVIQYRGYGKYRGLPALTFMVMGGVIGASVADEGSGSFYGDSYVYAMAGMMAGFVAGSIISAIIPGTLTISCK